MDERKRRVLQAIIDDYVRTAEPVGSRTIARHFDLGVSPATIRNEMADLEEMGYLEQPHTSAGRIPSDKGYRYYVDCLMAAPAAQPDADIYSRVLELKARRIDDLVREAARLLSEATHFLSLAATHTTEAPRVCLLQIVPLSSERALLLLVTDDGGVQSKVTELPRGISRDDLERIARVLSDRLAGAQLGSVSVDLARQLEGELGRFRGVLDEALQVLASTGDVGDRVVVGSPTALLRQPEFHDVVKAQEVLAVLERERFVDELLGLPALRDGLGVAIGREITVQEMRDCSLVTAVYTAPGHVAGRIGVLGPRRMDYGRVMSLVEQVARCVSDALDDDAASTGGRHRPARRKR